mgnify:CR=1 FL=1
MVNSMKRFLEVFLIAVFVIVILIVMDSSRLKEEQYNTKPIITIHEEYTEKYVRYDGIFYSMRYLTNSPQTKGSLDTKTIYGSEFWLFNKKLIWSNIS